MDPIRGRVRIHGNATLDRRRDGFDRSAQPRDEGADGYDVISILRARATHGGALLPIAEPFTPEVFGDALAPVPVA